MQKKDPCKRSKNESKFTQQYVYVINILIVIRFLFALHNVLNPQISLQEGKLYLLTLFCASKNRNFNSVDTKCPFHYYHLFPRQQSQIFFTSSVIYVPVNCLQTTPQHSNMTRM